ncbi:hypothetical protein FQR65_LT01482 [Abscondita terminalis]|nr:hypothetical protein FQR65_LT01482 [Abscondita terminalis]
MNKELQDQLMGAFREVIGKVCYSDTNGEKPNLDNCLSDITLRIRLEKSKTDNPPSKNDFSIEFLNCSPVNFESSNTFKSNGDFLFNKFASKKQSVKDLALWFNHQKFRQKKISGFDITDNDNQKYMRMVQIEPNNFENKSVQTETELNLISNRLVTLPEEVFRKAFNYFSRSENLTNYGRAVSNNNEHDNIVVSINFSNAIKLMTLFLAINTIVLLKFILWEQFSNFLF